ncbi:peptidoglycan-binding domain-containing protein [Streptomyces cellulosae]|uniref:peptidoglycan-binding domain-containing protein n=1 Tax=Streptomyces cellulosae TaxID=1968 RepID=UPI0004C60089|nr:peptidoglycan-binding domain-containing protein [Streptomyces cellulosae]
MPTPPDEGAPEHRPPLEPIRVLRPRRTDALAELIREYREQTGRYEPRPRGADAAGATPVVRPHAEEETQELPPVVGDRLPPVPAALPRDRRPLVPPAPPRDRPRGLRRIAVGGAVAAAAVVGFGCALLLPGRSDASAEPAPAAPPPPASAEPTPTASGGGASDPDGPGTLREGSSGPEVTDLQQRLLRIPNVYDNGSTSGRYDPTLTEAVARFQLWYGIRGDETGVYGDDTRLALESRTNAE